MAQTRTSRMSPPCGGPWGGPWFSVLTAMHQRSRNGRPDPTSRVADFSWYCVFRFAGQNQIEHELQGPVSCSLFQIWYTVSLMLKVCMKEWFRPLSATAYSQQEGLSVHAGAGHTLSVHTLALRDKLETPVFPAGGGSKVKRREWPQALQMLNAASPGL